MKLETSRLRGTQVVVSLDAPADRYYRHGWHSWSEARWLDPRTAPVAPVVPEKLPFADDPVYARRVTHGGSALGAAQLSDGTVALLGALDLGGRVELHGDDLVGSFESGTGDWFVGRGAEAAVFAEYAEALAERFGSRPQDRALTMWSSWYSYYDGISEAVLLDVLDDIADLGFGIFQVDDGWQRNVGDWTTNDKFPSGLAALGDAIRRRGHRPGLWLAPFIARDDSELVARRSDMLVTGDDGQPVLAGRNWGGACHALDVTHPDTADFLESVLRPVVEAGFTFLKLDFLSAGALPGRRARDLPREAAYRHGVDTIRRIVGDDVYLLACGAPVIASLGVFDGIRIGPDVAPWWEHTDVTRYLHDVSAPSARYAVATSAHRLWLSAIIDTDPDVAFFRSSHCLLSDEQRGVLQDMARIAGFRATSDPPSWLDDRERAELRAFLADEPVVERCGGHRYVVDGRTVDLGSIADQPPEFVEWLRP
jgi:alpha-galactosidase